ncbi:hypothetical protein PHYBOEH_003029 [Phytophthora boehmeriae]|uniref:Uncharacterized protein n=1 Tax=Phytophthora boehmeriae TaxID=109152 RepID=A0A8T1WWI1_9STRA|nr:hypothetical protein PHYBOEH_003029 [Phytophthora boehmeriae]
MAARLDLEARLRALRAGKRPAPTPPPSLPEAPSSPPAPVAAAASFSWPDVPSSPLSSTVAAPERVPVAVGDDLPRSRRSSRGFSTRPPVTIIRRSSSAEAADSASFQTSEERPNAPLQQQQRPEQNQGQEEDVLRLTAAQLLGPDYEEAVRIAQSAMDSERRQLPHTAIGAYIEAGQLLIEIGRRQAAPHLQEIVKAKALALLQRAEGLSEWTNAVLAKDSSREALAAAYHQSQENRYKSMTEKQQLVSKMQQDNKNMKEKLNQLALLTKIRGHMKRAVSNHRARKAAQAKARAELNAQAAAEATQEIMIRRGGFNDVTGEVDEGFKDLDDVNDVTGSEDEDEGEDGYSELFPRAPSIQAAGGSPRETQKVELINELHARIGLPQIDHLRKFEPLTNDPIADGKQEKLQEELEAAKHEADQLRAAVQEMEQCLRLAAQHQKQRSIKLEQQKAEEFAQVQDELERVREELESERRRSAFMNSSAASWRSSVSSNPNSEEFEDTGVMNQLRSSLHKVFRDRDHPDDIDAGRSSVQRTSYSHGSPRHTPKSREKKIIAGFDDYGEESVDEDDDGGVWL